MKRLLRSLGYPIESFPSAATFLASRSLSETACLITDINMPVMTGHELYTRLIELGYKIPTIFVTAYPENTGRSRDLKNGIVCYLRKPFNDIDLADCIRKAVEASDPVGGHESS
jgi:FixJ family two-component response regulator